MQLSDAMKVLKNRFHCQAAIESAIQIEEIKLEQKPTMTETIERLKLEKQEANKAWIEQGFFDGGNDTVQLS